MIAEKRPIERGIIHPCRSPESCDNEARYSTGYCGVCDIAYTGGIGERVDTVRGEKVVMAKPTFERMVNLIRRVQPPGYRGILDELELREEE